MKKINTHTHTRLVKRAAHLFRKCEITIVLRDIVKISRPLNAKQLIAGIVLWFMLSPIGAVLLQSLSGKVGDLRSPIGDFPSVKVHITTSDPEDLAKHAKKVLIITSIYVVLLAGLIAIALKHSKRRADPPETTLELPQLKTYTVQAALAGAHALRENPQRARHQILQKYASLRGFPLPETSVEEGASMRVEIGPDTVTLNTPYQGNATKLEVIARNGSLGTRVVIAPSGILETTIFDERTSKLLGNQSS